MLFQHMKANELPLLLDCLKSRTATFAKEYTILDEGDLTDEIGIVPGFPREKSHFRSG